MSEIPSKNTCDLPEEMAGTRSSIQDQVDCSKPMTVIPDSPSDNPNPKIPPNQPEVVFDKPPENSDQKKLTSQEGDLNLQLIIAEIGKNSLEPINCNAVLNFINTLKISLSSITNQEKKTQDVRSLIEKVKSKTDGEILQYIKQCVDKNMLHEFLYDFLILKTKMPGHKVVTGIEKTLSKNATFVNGASDVFSGNSDRGTLKEIHFDEIANESGEPSEQLLEIKNEFFGKIKGIDNQITNVVKGLGEIADLVSTEKDRQGERLNQFASGVEDIKKGLKEVRDKASIKKEDIIGSVADEIKSAVKGLETTFGEEVENLKNLMISRTPKNLSGSGNKSVATHEYEWIPLVVVGFIAAVTLGVVAYFLFALHKKTDFLTDQNNGLEKKWSGNLEKLSGDLRAIVSGPIGKQEAQILQVGESNTEEIVKKLKEYLPSAKSIKDLNDKLGTSSKTGVAKLPEGNSPPSKLTEDDKKDIAQITKAATEDAIKEKIVKIADDDKAKGKNQGKDEGEPKWNDLLKSVKSLENDLKTQKSFVAENFEELKKLNKPNTGFKGPRVNFAILLTNSKDFELNEPILSATLVAVEKQIKDSAGIQKFGIYTATGIDVNTKLNLKTGEKGDKPTRMDAAIGRPTESLAEAGKTFLEYAFDDGKGLITPVGERKAIIIATWAAGAPKAGGEGWKDISQVDAILIQTPKANQLRDGAAWLDFINKKNGKLLFLQQTEEKFNAGSQEIVQLEKHLWTLFNAK